MGKRKDKTVQGNRSRRRQILQLDDDSNHGYPNPAWQVGCSSQVRENMQEEAEVEEDKKVHNNPLSGLLSHYMDSEDETDEPPVQPEVANGLKGESSGSANGDKNNRIDLEVADFLKEIDALTSTEDLPNDEADAKQGSLTNFSNGSNENSREASSSTDPSTSKTVDVSAAWQECYDDITGYTYYWNTISNQVTWDCPEEFRLHKEKTEKDNSKQSIGEVDHASEDCVKNKDTVRASQANERGEKRDHSSDEDGKIEPITFYGPSSSNDDSSSDDNHPKHWKKQKTNEDESTLLSNTNLAKDYEVKGHAPNFGDEVTSPTGIGPQLPPGYVLPGTESPELVSPQLPAEFSSPIVSQENSTPSCDVDLTSHLEELSPTSTGHVNGADIIKNLPSKLDEKSSGTCTSPDPNKELESSLITHSISSPISTQPASVAEPSLSQLQYLDEIEEPDSTTRNRQKPEVENQAMSSGSTDMGNLFLGPRNIPQILPTMYDESEDENDQCSAQMTISSSAPMTVAPSYYEEDNVKGNTNNRCGFGFKKQETFLAAGNEETNKQRNSHISFVKAETLDLNAINRQMVSEWTSNAKEGESEQASDVIASQVLEQNGITQNNENDIDEIDRELDLAFERKKKTLSLVDDAGASSSSSSLTSSLSLSLLSKLAEKRQRNSRNDDSGHAQKKATLESLQSDEIADLASALFDRLASMGVVEENISTLHTHFIQIKPKTKKNQKEKSSWFRFFTTRSHDFSVWIYLVQKSYSEQTHLDDWRNGALEPSYVLACLRQTEEDIHHHESGSSTPHWGDHLDRIPKQPQSDSVSGKECWELPEVDRPDTTGNSKGLETSLFDKNNPVVASEQMKLRSFTISSSNSNSVSSSTGPSAGNSFMDLPSHPLVLTQQQKNSIPPLPPGPDPSVPPPPPPPPPESPPPPPPDSTETEENDIVDMDVDEPSLPRSIIHTHSADMVSLPSTPPMLSEGHLIIPEQQVATTENATFVISKPPVPSNLVSAFPLDNPGSSGQPNLQMELSSFYSDITSLSVEPEEAQPQTLAVQQPSTVETKLVPAVTSTETLSVPGPSHSVASTSGIASVFQKKEKKFKKTKMSTGLVLKKKNMPSLVEKWQKIKQEQARQSSSSDEECVSTTRQFE